MTDLVVFVEERSAGIIVGSVASRIAPARLVKIVEHEGKQDLRRSYPRKISAWRHPVDVPFVILHDNDGNDCSKLKARLTKAVPAGARRRTKIRIVMQCLESWYLGDAQACAAAGLVSHNRVQALQAAARFRDPDLLVNAKQEFLRLHREVGQISLARRIAPHLNLDTNTSHSFQVLVATLRALIG